MKAQDPSASEWWPGRPAPVVLALLAIYAAVELTLALGDLGLFDIPRFRAWAYESFGFWPGLLYGWTPNFRAQPVTMFFTYGFLHSGFGHFFVNMLTLIWLSPLVLARVGSFKFGLIYGLSILGGAVGYAALSGGFRPMVGASGALFGLAGAFLAWEYIERFGGRGALWPILRAVILLVGLNVVLYFAMNRLLAWEAHLGGFVFGWLAAMLVDPIRRDGPG